MLIPYLYYYNICNSAYGLQLNFWLVTFTCSGLQIWRGDRAIGKVSSEIKIMIQN